MPMVSIVGLFPEDCRWWTSDWYISNEHMADACALTIIQVIHECKLEVTWIYIGEMSRGESVYMRLREVGECKA